MCRAFFFFTSLALAWVGLLGGTGCTWQPEARPVQPQLMLPGPARIDRLIDPLTTQRFVLITRDPAGEAPRRAIFERATKKVCDLPPGTFQVDPVLVDPTSTVPGPAFLLPIIVEEEGEDRALYYADEHCGIRGPFGRARSLLLLELDSGQQVSLVGNGRGTLTMVNPWTSEVTHIAEQVSLVSSVRRPVSGSTPVGPQTLWLIENGALTQRTLMGDLLFSRGTAVREFAQALFDTLRVAYVDGSDLYEAVAPDFVPYRIAQDACSANYSGLDLNFFSPCKPQQLVRIDLTSGAATTFETGTYANYQQSGYLFEYIRDGSGNMQLFATPPGEIERKLVEPTLRYGSIQVVDSHRIVGNTESPGQGRPPGSEEAGDPRFMLWDSHANASVALLRQIARPIPFIDIRDNEILWVFPHDVMDRRGTLSLFRQSSFAPEVIGTGIPTNAFSVEILQQVSEAALVYIEDAQPVSETDNRLRGKLHARLVSGELGAVVDENVTTYVAVYTPLEGLIYTVEDGERSGLWFAAL